MRWICNLFTPNPAEVRKRLLLEMELELIRAQVALDGCRLPGCYAGEHGNPFEI